MKTAGMLSRMLTIIKLLNLLGSMCGNEICFHTVASCNLIELSFQKDI